MPTARPCITEKMGTLRIISRSTGPGSRTTELVKVKGLLVLPMVWVARQNPDMLQQLGLLIIHLKAMAMSLTKPDLREARRSLHKVGESAVASMIWERVELSTRDPGGQSRSSSQEQWRTGKVQPIILKLYALVLFSLGLGVMCRLAMLIMENLSKLAIISSSPGDKMVMLRGGGGGCWTHAGRSCGRGLLWLVVRLLLPFIRDPGGVHYGHNML